MGHFKINDFNQGFQPVLSKIMSPSKFVDGKPESDSIERVCATHGKYTATLEYHSSLNKHYEHGCPDCIDSQERERKAQEDEYNRKLGEEQYNKKLTNAGVTKRFREKSFDNFEADTLPKRRALELITKYSDNFKSELDVGRCLILHGKTGTGKNHLASALVMTLVKGGYRPILIKLFDLVDEVKQTWRSKDSDEHLVLNKFKSCDLLILDEVGVQFSTDAERLILFNVLNYRYENIKPTIVISNYPIDSKDGNSIRNVLGDRVLDRLRENGGSQIAFDWESFRK